MLGRSRIELKTPAQVDAMRRAAMVVHEALEATSAAVRPGVTTAELDAVAAEVIASAGATSNFLHYGADEDGRGGFTGVVCLSVNAEVVHGVPGTRVLAEGDLLSIDCGAVVDGWHADAARTVPVGEPSDARRALSEATRRAMWAGIRAVRPGGRVGDVSAAVQASVEAEPQRYGIVAEYVGHGIGSQMHMEPDVPNSVARGPWPGGRRGPRLVPGMVLCIEPMLTAGSADTRTLDDGWTVATRDGSDACHWESMVAVTEDGIRVLSEPDEGAAHL
ncbi:type I methionyl aminopeptidase [Desertihabitans brevis]|uniref:Methionine aminopeptidase n=1 Tax=Desertihabitans brevis TaxID=2268447 RepID=A0A367YV71_9ACTN|nr:type I methionyl aminopeptidase [Desertihabitans brevis]RCK69764.1 type I methionyl aminopeptidase [Desertihabitans brevis]